MAKRTGKADKSRTMIYVIVGKDSAVVDREYERLIDQLLGGEQRAVGLFSADSNTSVTEVLDELRTPPFLSDKKIVAVRDADDFISANRALLERYFERPSETAVLVMTVRSFAANTKLAKMISSVGKVIRLGDVKEYQLPAKLREYALEAHGKRLGREAAELLISLVGGEVGLLYGEIDKLALFSGQSRDITIEHIKKLVAGGRVYNIFNAIDCAVEGNRKGAIEAVRAVFAQDRAAEYTFIGAMAFHLRRMFTAKVMMEEGASFSAISRKLRLWYNSEGFLSRLRGVSLKQIGDMIRELAEADFLLKTGRATAAVLAERFIIRLSDTASL